MKAFLFILLLALPAWAAMPYERGWAADLNLDLGVSADALPVRDIRFAGRVRIGAMYMLEPWYLTAGMIAQYVYGHTLAAGLQLEAMNLWTGLTGTTGFLVEGGFGGRTALTVGLGYGVFGLEAQMWSRPDGMLEPRYMAKIRIPITWLMMVGKPPRIPKDETR